MVSVQQMHGRKSCCAGIRSWSLERFPPLCLPLAQMLCGMGAVDVDRVVGLLHEQVLQSRVHDHTDPGTCVSSRRAMYCTYMQWFALTRTGLFITYMLDAPPVFQTHTVRVDAFQTWLCQHCSLVVGQQAATS